MPLPEPRDPGTTWYERPSPDGALAQGDQLWGLRILDAYFDEQGRPVADEIEIDVIVLTQSCDLEHAKVATVLTAPFHGLGEWIQENPADLPRLEDIRQGYDTSLYLLPAWPESPDDGAQQDRVVNFGQLYTVRYDVLETACERGNARVALRSPAREHFAQAVARSFMRVGLPIDVPSFRLERAGREDRQLHTLTDVQDLLGSQTCVLVRPLAVTLQRRVRVSTGGTYLSLSTREREPAIAGAGLDTAQAERSLSRQIVRRWLDLLAGDERRAWLRGAVTPDQ